MMQESRQFKDDERRYFDDHLEEYLRRFCRGRWLAYKQYVERRVRQMLGSRDGLRVLDIGSGPMPAFASLVAEAEYYACSDLAERPLRYLAERHPHCACVLADAEHLPFASGMFDLVISFGLLHHLPNPAMAAREIRRVLRPRGVIVASEPSERWSADTAAPDDMASPHERGFRVTDLYALFAGMDVDVYSFNHTLAEKAVGRLARLVPGWNEAGAPLWHALFNGERLLHTLGLLGNDFLVLARDRG